MFGEEVGYTSEDERQLSEDRKGRVDEVVKKILEESEARVEKLLLGKDKELRDIARNLYWYDYLDYDEMDKIFKGKSIEKDKEKVREWNDSENSGTKQGIFGLQL